jgi:hypothetical protein
MGPVPIAAVEQPDQPHSGRYAVRATAKTMAALPAAGATTLGCVLSAPAGPSDRGADGVPPGAMAIVKACREWPAGRVPTSVVRPAGSVAVAEITAPGVMSGRAVTR